MNVHELKSSVRKSYMVLAGAIAEHAPTRVYVAYSGGKDSALVLALSAPPTRVLIARLRARCF